MSVEHRPVTTTTGVHRLSFLDGLRGLAAVYVVISHIWDTVFAQHLPADQRLRSLTAFLGFGRYAVALFIVVSGFSIGLGAWKGGLRWPGGTRTYLVRRFMRIWPPYAVAVILSSLLALTVLSSKDGTLFDGANSIRASGVVTHLLMIQDIHWAGPAGSTAFWSIPVEFHIYLFFLLVLVLVRRSIGSWAIVAAGLVALTGIVAALPSVAVAHWIYGLSPSLYALFVIGFAASESAAGGRAGVQFDARRWHRAVLGLGGLGALVILADHAHWIPLSPLNDLVLGPLFAFTITQLVRGRWQPLQRLLSSRGAVWLGDSSYSLYLSHAVVIEIVWRVAVAPVTRLTALRLVLELLLGTAASVLVARVFYACVERPFLRGRTLLAGPNRAPQGVSRAQPERAVA
ncbi:MAG TPA: acyltransferase [Solirubrobacteraceae bacterium]|jgi:peptidoglycan/LPS O-acetylase OafA/YrhL|nr:acyltransferase [Solirubrobacteraceae bacterium]